MNSLARVWVVSHGSRARGANGGGSRLRVPSGRVVKQPTFTD